MTTTTTTIRARDEWLAAMQALADRWGVSRSVAIQVSSALGARVLQQVTLTQAQMDALIGGE